jgi:hypothetical protein
MVAATLLPIVFHFPLPHPAKSQRLRVQLRLNLAPFGTLYTPGVSKAMFNPDYDLFDEHGNRKCLTTDERQHFFAAVAAR